MVEKIRALPIDAARLNTSTGEDSSQAENGIPPEFLDQIPKSFLDFIVRESLRSPVHRFIEAGLIANDAVLAGFEAVDYVCDRHKGRDMYESNGPTVIVAPGFWAKGSWYGPTKTFLQNAGCKVIVYGEDEHNVQPLEYQVPHFVKFVREQAQKTGDFVNLWLHSKAAIMGYGAYSLHTSEMIENVDRVVAVGSALPRWVNPMILGAYYGSQLAFNGRDFEWARKVGDFAKSTNMKGLKVTTISKVADPIMRGDPFGQDHMPIEGSHIGNGWSLETMRLGLGVLRGKGDDTQTGCEIPHRPSIAA